MNPNKLSTTALTIFRMLKRLEHIFDSNTYKYISINLQDIGTIHILRSIFLFEKKNTLGHSTLPHYNIIQQIE